MARGLGSRRVNQRPAQDIADIALDSTVVRPHQVEGELCCPVDLRHLSRVPATRGRCSLRLPARAPRLRTVAKYARRGRAWSKCYGEPEGGHSNLRHAVTYSHNAEADFAGSELARLFAAAPELCHAATEEPPEISVSATNEPSASVWPRADGVLLLLEARTNARRDIALEYKRANEGVHGLLTAIGQAHAYLDKGYHGVAIVVPESYTTLADAGAYVTRVLDDVSTARAIGVFTYQTPDTTSPTPFAGRLRCHRPLEVVQTTTRRPALGGSGARTQWVHMREGSTTRDAFLRFLQVAKRLSAGEEPPAPMIPAQLRAAIHRIAPGKEAAEYLANTADDRFLARVWRTFWFEWVATPQVLTPWIQDGTVYRPPGAFTRIERDDGRAMSQIFEGRANGLKESLVGLLNAGAVTEPDAWEMFAAGIAALPGRQAKQGVRDRAHSYREDLDSSLMRLDWIGDDGRPTEYGYKYASLCERFGGANSPAAREYLSATLLQTGRYEAFLHYIYRLSERRFAADPLAYTRLSNTGVPVFDEDSYWEYLADLEREMTDELKVIRKVSGRDRPRRRTTFQVELTLLRTNGLVSRRRYRLGVGIPIDWERVIEALNVEL
jgi:hypothetical protein